LHDVAAMASTVPAAYLGTTTRGRTVADWDAATSSLRIIETRVDETSH
jgi:hypothetical protein